MHDPRSEAEDRGRSSTFAFCCDFVVGGTRSSTGRGLGSDRFPASTERVLLTAAAAGFFYSVHLLLSALADPSTVGHDSRSALHVAVLKDSPMTVRLLLNSKADVHVQDFGRETPLHYAAVRNLQHCVRQDALGGSSNQNALFQIQANKEAARARKMRRIVTWTADGMELPVRGDAADALVPLNYKHFAACQDINTLAWLNPHSRDR
eukprot:s1809_g1.t1